MSAREGMPNTKVKPKLSPLSDLSVGGFSNLVGFLNYIILSAVLLVKITQYFGIYA